VERIPGPSERVIVERARWPARGDEARARLVLKKMGDEVELRVDEAQAMKDHGLDRMADGPYTHGRILLGSLSKDLGDAELCKHARDQAQVIEDLCAVRWRRRRDGRAG
jgi:hypothetical protein